MDEIQGIFTSEHLQFRDALEKFVRKEIEPYVAEWEREARFTPKEVYRKAASAGLLGTAIPEEFGGAGGDPLYAIIHAEVMSHSLAGASVGGMFTTDILAELIVNHGTEAQKQEWFPRILAGAPQAFALTEPDAGSDIFKMRTRARHDGDDFLISGQKIYISNGMPADLIYLICKTDKDASGPRGSLTLFLVDAAQPGIERRRLDSLGMKSHGLAEIFFDEVRVPRSAMLGDEGTAMRSVLAPPFLAFDRVISAMTALASAELAFDLTLDYVKTREVFGGKVIDFQNTQFKLAEMKATLVAARAFREHVLRKIAQNELDDFTASCAKLWISDSAFNIVNECLQLHGGYGYMNESPISRIFTYARLTSIYAGSSEIQKKTIARTLVNT